MTMNDSVTLFEFQAEDVAYLADQPAVLIGNQMGTGKTIQAIARDDQLHKDNAGVGHTLVIAPLSVLPSWAKHFRSMTDLTVATVHNKKRDQSWELFLRNAPDVLLIHYEAARIMEAELKTVEWFHIICDEVHRIQNRETRWTKAIKSLSADYKTGLSGTPITNTPDKLWSLLNWLYPKGPGLGVELEDRFYTSYWRFRAKFCEETIDPAGGYRQLKGPKVANLPLLHEMMKPYFVRHLKKEQCCRHHLEGVLPQLPDKVYSPQWIELSPSQRRNYEDMRKDMLTYVGDNEDKPLVAGFVISQLMRLQQFTVASCDIDLRPGANSGKVTLSDPSSKLDAVMQILEDNPTEQIVVFSQFAQLIVMLNKRMKEKGISYVSIMGSVPAALRGGMVDKFQSGEKRVFTGTVAAGGEGITLTAASTVVFTDRSWSPAMNSQAEDRLHRIGQKDTVNVIDILAINTVDLGKQQKLIKKWSDIRLLLGDD